MLGGGEVGEAGTGAGKEGLREFKSLNSESLDGKIKQGFTGAEITLKLKKKNSKDTSKFKISPTGSIQLKAPCW